MSSCPLPDVLATAELPRRPARPPNYRVEAQVMAILAQAIADRPQSILQVLVESAVEMLGGGTCGISLPEKDQGSEIFRWVAMAGVLGRFAGGSTPRHFSPCGITMDRNEAQLFVRPARHFDYFRDLQPPIEEGVVIPFFSGGECLGTIWIVTHNPDRHFDMEDIRIMSRLGAFTAASLRVQRSLAAAEEARQEARRLYELATSPRREGATAARGGAA